MIKGRILMLIGEGASLVGALLLLLCGHSLIGALSTLVEPRKGLVNDLGLTTLGAAALGIGFCLVTWSFRLARRSRALTSGAKAVVALGGVLTALGGALLFAEFRHAHEQLTALSVAPASQLDEAGREKLARLIRVSSERSTHGYFALLCGQIVAGIGLWALFWSERRHEETKPLSAPVPLVAVLSAGAFAGAIVWAARQGGQALSAAGADAALASVAPKVLTVFTFGTLGAGCLVVYGASQALIATLFPTDRRG